MYAVYGILDGKIRDMTSLGRFGKVACLAGVGSGEVKGSSEACNYREKSLVGDFQPQQPLSK